MTLKYRFVSVFMLAMILLPSSACAGGYYGCDVPTVIIEEWNLPNFAVTCWDNASLTCGYVLFFGGIAVAAASLVAAPAVVSGGSAALAAGSSSAVSSSTGVFTTGAVTSGLKWLGLVYGVNNITRLAVGHVIEC